MANVWKIGSRWSSWGASDKSVLSIFRRNNIVFIGDDSRKRFLAEVKKGDYFAIADGYRVVSVAKAVCNPQYIQNFKVIVKPNELDRFDYEECKSWAVGVRVKIVDLSEEEQLLYQKRGSFFRANQIRDNVIDFYENQENRFNIKSYTYSLLSSSDRQGLLDSKRHYIIPIYQRPYSWGDREILPLLEDLKNGCLGRNKKGTSPEPIFIGTMQLSSLKFISNEDGFEQHIIDGQQRITTLSILLKELSMLLPDHPKLKRLKFDWLETHVNETNEGYLNDYFMGLPSDDYINNRYAANGMLIADYLQENLSFGQDNNWDTALLDANTFVDYIFNNIFFVVIETHAGLSKTLQIFKAINTTGLDLNSGDLFKIRMYEYMTDHLHYGEEAFEIISKLYDYIDSKNEEAKSHIVDIAKVLDTYKFILIARYNLSNSLLDENWEKFYEDLFDMLLGVKYRSEYLPKVGESEIEIFIDELREIVDVHAEWYYSKYPSTEAMFGYNLLMESRYRRYTRIAYPFLYIHRKEEDRYEALYKIFIELNKVFFIYSIGYSKIINEVHTFMNKVQRALVLKTTEEAITLIKSQKQNAESWSKNQIGKYIADNRTWKNLICKMSEYLRMQSMGVGFEDTKRLLFETPFDIEHIHANADDTKGWTDETLQNSIGNLALLEYQINRSIGCKPYSEKRCSSSGDVDYQKSEYTTIRFIANDFQDWTEKEARLRREEEKEKIYNYIFS